MILGWLTFEDRAGDDFNGGVTWIKPALTASPLYTNGFTFGTNATGARYAPPVTPVTPLLTFADGLVEFTGANLDPGFGNTVRIDPGNKVVNLSSNKLTFTIVTPSGLFNGAVSAPGSTASQPFKGALNLKAGFGAGYLTGPTANSRVVLQAAP